MWPGTSLIDFLKGSSPPVLVALHSRGSWAVMHLSVVPTLSALYRCTGNIILKIFTCCSQSHCHPRGTSALPLLRLVWFSHEQFTCIFHILYLPFPSYRSIHLHFLSQLKICLIIFKFSASILWGSIFPSESLVRISQKSKLGLYLPTRLHFKHFIWMSLPCHQRRLAEENCQLLSKHLPMWFCQRTRWLNSSCGQWAQGQNL